jgi:TPR repeat protein
MKKNLKILLITFFVIITSIILFFSYQKYKYNQTIKNMMDTTYKTLEIDNPIVNEKNQDFVFTKNELSEMEKWKREGKSFEILIEDALKGNRAGLYTLGFGYLTGYPQEIFKPDLKSAFIFFSKSASLGFAPSVHNLHRIYINNIKNALLATVYIKLCILLGHTEFNKNYIELTKSFQSSCIGLLNEMERIALQKYTTIIENKNKNFNAITNIVDEDSNYDNQYWENIVKKCKGI